MQPTNETNRDGAQSAQPLRERPIPNFYGHLVTGVAAAWTEVIPSGQMLLRWKIAAQNQEPMQWETRMLVRALPVHLFMQTISFGASASVNGAVTNYFSQNGKRKLTTADEFISAVAAGFAAGVICSPIEKGLQRNGEYLKEIHRGMGATIVREVGFSSGLFFLGPWADRKIRQLLPSQVKKEYSILISIIAGIAGGTVAAIGTHPFEEMRGKIHQKGSPYKNMAQAFVGMYKEGGWKRFYPSFVPRWVRLCTAISLLTTAKEAYTSVLVVNKERCPKLFVDKV